ncbi:MAG: thiamine pyrophosphate-binding protein [Desulfuromonadales bacterium]|nr:thiamine pyrophosphate-binding protein [Desulfuromonadales bacterium]
MKTESETKQAISTVNGHKNISGADALLQALIEEGTEVIFGYPGGAIMPVYDALLDYQDKLRHILTRHEQGAAHSAQAYAMVTGKTSRRTS